MILKLKRRINKKIKGKSYWKWYVDIPAEHIKRFKLTKGSEIILI